MPPVKIVVWDNIGNVLLGARPWSSWSPHVTERLLAEDSAGPSHAPSFAELFADYEVELSWFRDATRPATFGDLAADYEANLRPLASMDELAAAIGFDEPPAPPVNPQRLTVLEQLGRGDLSPEEALEQLRSGTKPS